jgi:hypothetical protein
LSVKTKYKKQVTVDSPLFTALLDFFKIDLNFFVPPQDTP